MWKLDEAGTVYPQIKKVNIEWLPMVKYYDNENLSQYVENLLSVCDTQSDIRLKFLNYLYSQIQGVDQYTGIQNWYELDFREFILELHKVIKKAGGIKLSRMKEMEWMDIFELKRMGVLKLKKKIDMLDREIDQMVYELYGLTEEEIRIVEEMTG